jgi:hypothetical protein
MNHHNNKEVRGHSSKAVIDSFFKDKRGNWAVVQFPNVLLSVWILLVIVTFFVSDKHIRVLQSTVLFAWAYIEVMQGSSYFRKMLGAVVLVGVVLGIFLA